MAGYAAGEMPLDAEADPSHGRTQFDGWQNVLSARLEELAVAISTGRPEFFVEQVHWTRSGAAGPGRSARDAAGEAESLRGVLVEQIPAELSPMATACIDRALAEFDGEPAGLTPRLTAETPAKRLAATYLLAILEGDRRKAIGLILKAADEGQSVPTCILKVLQPAQEELGRMWLLGEINVAEEHFATTTTRLVMAQLHAREACGPSNGKTLVAAAVAGNQHDLGIQVVADLFESGRLAGDPTRFQCADRRPRPGRRVLRRGSRRTFRLARHAVDGAGGDHCRDSGEPNAALCQDPGRRLRDDGCRRLAKSKGADDYASNAVEAVTRGNGAGRTACENAVRRPQKKLHSSNQCIIPKRPADVLTPAGTPGNGLFGSVCRDGHGRMAMAPKRCRSDPCQDDPRQPDQRVDESAEPDAGPNRAATRSNWNRPTNPQFTAPTTTRTKANQ